MKDYIYFPRSLRSAGKQIGRAFRAGVEMLPKREFLRAWCAISYLYPGLHPDGFESDDSGWPRALKPFAAEAWRRYETDQISEGELYCYEVCKARLVDEVGVAALESAKKPWLFCDHFAA